MFDPGYTYSLHCDSFTALNLSLSTVQYNILCIWTNCFIVFLFFRRVWLRDGRAADSGGVCSQSCCQDDEEWVDCKSTSQSPQWIPSSWEHRPFHRKHHGSNINKCFEQKSNFMIRNQTKTWLVEYFGRRSDSPQINCSAKVKTIIKNKNPPSKMAGKINFRGNKI